MTEEMSSGDEVLTNGPHDGWSPGRSPQPWLDTATRISGTVAVVFATLACIPMLGVLSGYEFLALVLPAFPTVLTGILAPNRSAGRALAVIALAIIVLGGIFGAISYYTYAGPPGSTTFVD